MSEKKPKTKKEPEPVPCAPAEATVLMKTVASKSLYIEKAKKVFTEEELAEIVARRNAGEEVHGADKMALREYYRKVKAHAKEMEAGNKSCIIVFPSYSARGDKWYKTIDFSALYYVYRLANKMGRKASILQDRDNYSKALYAASFQNIDKFLEDFVQLESGNIEETLDGIYICHLAKELSDDEVGMLRRIQDTERRKTHDTIRPKEMDPAVYQGILTLIRQVVPKVKKMNRTSYWSIGQAMVDNLQNLMAVYFNFTQGIYAKEDAGKMLVETVNKLLAAVSMLSELGEWKPRDCSVMGAAMVDLKKTVSKNFGLGKKSNG